jgi:DNA-binding Lrp family transcriptional regulator
MGQESRRSKLTSASTSKIVRHRRTGAELDRIDRVLLDALQKNARSSYKDLAALAGVSPSTCLERVRSLQRRGVITGFRAELELPSLGRPLEALVAIRFRTHDRALVDPFVEYLLSLPETVALLNVSGDDDYLLHIAVADTEHLHAFVLDRLGVRREVEHVRTSLVYRHLRKMPLEPLALGEDGVEPISAPLART